MFIKSKMFTTFEIRANHLVPLFPDSVSGFSAYSSEPFSAFIPSSNLLDALPLCDLFAELGKVCKSLKNQKMISMRLRMLIPENKPTRPP